MKTLNIFIFVVLGFVAGVTIAIMRSWGSGEVIAEINNEMVLSIVSATYFISTCGTKIELTVGSIDAGSSKKYRFSVCGEGSYYLVLELPDGSMLSSQESYVESGNRVSDAVIDGSIRTDINFIGY